MSAKHRKKPSYPIMAAMSLAPPDLLAAAVQLANASSSSSSDTNSIRVNGSLASHAIVARNDSLGSNATSLARSNPLNAFLLALSRPMRPGVGPPHLAAPWAIAPTQRPPAPAVSGPPPRSLILANLTHAGPPRFAPPHYAAPWAVTPTQRRSGPSHPWGIPRTGLRPAAPIAPMTPLRPDQYDDKSKLDHYENMGAVNKFALSVLFGPTPSGRSRAYVHDIYGYMPFGDGYGGAVLGGASSPPWWWDSQERSPYMSSASWGPASWLPERATPTCPPDCEPEPYDLRSQQPV